MALISCKECNREVSDQAKTCPHCGIVLISEEPEPFAPQQVEITGIKFNRPKNTKIIIIAVISVLIIIAAAVTIFVIKGNIEAQAAQAEAQAQAEAEAQARTKYINDLETFSLAALRGGADAERVCNLTKSVWRNTIYETRDAETDQYTRKNGAFHDDFNVSLNALYKDEAIIEKINLIKDSQTTVAELYKALQDPTDEFKRCYELVETLYNTYVSLTNLAISPEGNLTSYSEKFSALDSAFMEDYNKLELLTPKE